METFTKEFDALIRAWGLKEFHLVGTSWGGTLAMEVFLRSKGKGSRSLTFQSPLLSSAHWKADCEALIGKLSAKNRKIILACHEVGATDAKVYEEADREPKGVSHAILFENPEPMLRALAAFLASVEEA